MNPEISVVMPVWNGCSRGSEVFLRQAIQSILDQTYENFEFIIVDDGSTDSTPNILKEYASKDNRIIILRNETNLKISKSLNKGIAHAKTSLIARQDADDMSTPTRLELQKQFLDARPETHLCGSGMFVIDEENRLLMEIKHPCNYIVVREILKTWCPFVHGSVMFRKKAFDETGGYSSEQDIEYAEDYDLWVRMAAKGVLENIPDKVLYFHRNHNSKSSSVFTNKQASSTANVSIKAKKILG